MIIIIFPLFIMSHAPPLRRTLISTSRVWRCKLRGLLHHVTSRLAAGGRHNKWQMSTHFGYHPNLCCPYLFSYNLKPTLTLSSDPMAQKRWRETQSCNYNFQNHLADLSMIRSCHGNIYTIETLKHIKDPHCRAGWHEPSSWWTQCCLTVVSFFKNLLQLYGSNNV